MNPLDLHALVDGELTAADAARVRADAARDPRAAAELASLYSLKRRLGDGLAVELPERGWADCAARFREIERASRVDAFVGRWAPAMCAGVFAVIVGAGLLNRGPAGGGVRSADLARMMSSFGSLGAAPAAPGSEQAKALLRQAEVSLDPSRVQILGATTIESDGMRVVRVNLRDPSGDLAVLLLPPGVRLQGERPVQYEGRYAISQIAQLNAVGWANPAATVVLLGDRSTADLTQIADRLDR